MKDLEKRLENIYKGIEKILSLQSDLENTNKKLKADNQELNAKIKAFESQLTKTREDGMAVQLEKQKQNTHQNKEINHKIDELLSEVERCITLLKK